MVTTLNLENHGLGSFNNNRRGQIPDDRVLLTSLAFAGTGSFPPSLLLVAVHVPESESDGLHQLCPTLLASKKISVTLVRIPITLRPRNHCPSDGPIRSEYILLQQLQLSR